MRAPQCPDRRSHSLNCEGWDSGWDSRSQCGVKDRQISCPERAGRSRETVGSERQPVTLGRKRIGASGVSPSGCAKISR